MTPTQFNQLKKLPWEWIRWKLPGKRKHWYSGSTVPSIFEIYSTSEVIKSWKKWFYYSVKRYWEVIAQKVFMTDYEFICVRDLTDKLLPQIAIWNDFDDKRLLNEIWKILELDTTLNKEKKNTDNLLNELDTDNSFNNEFDNENLFDYTDEKTHQDIKETIINLYPKLKSFIKENLTVTTKDLDKYERWILSEIDKRKELLQKELNEQSKKLWLSLKWEIYLSENDINNIIIEYLTKVAEENRKKKQEEERKKLELEWELEDKRRELKELELYNKWREGINEWIRSEQLKELFPTSYKNWNEIWICLKEKDKSENFNLLNFFNKYCSFYEQWGSRSWYYEPNQKDYYVDLDFYNQDLVDELGIVTRLRFVKTTRWETGTAPSYQYLSENFEWFDWHEEILIVALYNDFGESRKFCFPLRYFNDWYYWDHVFIKVNYNWLIGELSTQWSSNY